MPNVNVFTRLVAKAGIAFKRAGKIPRPELGELIQYNGKLLLGTDAPGIPVHFPIGHGTPSYVHSQGLSSDQWAVKHDLDVSGDSVRLQRKR